MKTTRHQTWKNLLDCERAAYKRSPVGVFSVAGHPVAERVGQIIDCYSLGTCLDVGCGCLPLPCYMRRSKNTEWFGIDPFEGDHVRQFEFTQGCAEELPYPDSFFDGVLFASTIDHLLDPRDALREAHRVLKSTGHLFIWFSNRPNAIPYDEQGDTPFNHLHLWGFNDSVLKQLVQGSMFGVQAIKTLVGIKSRMLIGTKASENLS